MEEVEPSVGRSVGRSAARSSQREIRHALTAISTCVQWPIWTATQWVQRGGQLSYLGRCTNPVHPICALRTELDRA